MNRSVDREHQSRIGEKHFTQPDLAAFASLSRDFNPVHTDPHFAKRVLTGKPVVHGMHLILQALDFWAAGNTSRIGHIACEFKSPVSVGETIFFYQQSISDSSWQIRGMAGERLCFRMRISTVDEKQLMSPLPLSEEITSFDALTYPLDMAPENCVGKSCRITTPLLIGKTDFPLVRARIGDSKVAALLAISYFFGMVCPGLHSLLATVNLLLEGAPQSSGDSDTLCFRVDDFDERFNIFYISLCGEITGTLTVLRRPPPVSQPSLSALAGRVNAEEFAGRHSLVIGGSRGLGEATAKLLVAGGGTVTVTCATGRMDAERLCDELNKYRAGSCRVQVFDVLQDNPVKLADEIERATEFYYFATPRIFQRSFSTIPANEFDDRLYEEFHNFYVTKFELLCHVIESRITKPACLFVPSSVAVDVPQSDLREYAKAKTGMESLVEALNNKQGKLRIITARLPRTETDQTNTFSRVQALPAVDIMLPLIRRVRAGG